MSLTRWQCNWRRPNLIQNFMLSREDGIAKTIYNINVHLHVHRWVMAYLTDGFATLVPLSLSIDTPEAGSTCNASSMQPDEGLQKQWRYQIKYLQDFHAAHRWVSYAKFISGNNEIQIGSLLPSPLGSYPNKPSPDLF